LGLVEVWVAVHTDLENQADIDLLRLSRSREDAFAVFYRRYERLVAGWLMRRTGRPELVADLTAEVFAAAYLGAERFRDGPEPAGAWLLGIARNKLLRSLRRDRTEASARRRLAIERVAVSYDSLAAIEELRGIGVVELLEQLPDDQREAVRARVLAELDYEQLARANAISPAAARKRVSRGLGVLRRRLEEEGRGGNG
jgi:RNA polymerase sigma factor (sigma-70 family)